MEILIGKKQAHPFVFVKARRCGSNSLNVWLENNIGRDNYIDLSGDNWSINFDLFDDCSTRIVYVINFGNDNM